MHLFLILVVLLQQGKGADLSVFGGGGTMTAFGARGAATVLHKLTVGSFVAFMITTLAIGVMEGRRENSSVMSDVPIEEAAEDAEVTPAGALADEEEAVEDALDGAAENLEEGAAAAEDAVIDAGQEVEEAVSEGVDGTENGG